MTALLKSTDAITKIPRAEKPQGDGTVTAKALAKQEARERRNVKSEFKRRCKRKARYDNWHEARDAVRQVKAQTGSTQYPYPCPSCQGWHLTTRNPKQQSQIRKIYDWAKGDGE